LNKYKVIDNDAAIDYDSGEEVLGITEAESPQQAIDLILGKFQHVQDLKAFDPEGFSKYILSTITAEVYQ
tara:strand:+ start:168 stop:377 length:210 start_codon:yes stop_codon:yes gene_type:complete